MRFNFVDQKLRTLYVTGKSRFSDEIVHAFFRVMGHIDQAVDERDLRSLKGLRYEKLKGDRKGQYSVRLNKQFRLIVQPGQDSVGRVMNVLEIVDYH
jgi:proteic killer suppression protein